jgi:putative glycosyltransferase (TIGR04372 family)
MNQMLNNADSEPTKFQKYLKAQTTFDENFNKVFSTGDPEQIINCLDKFYSEYPVLKQFLPQLYDQLLKLGLVSIANEAARVYVEANLKIAELGSCKYGVPPFCIPYRLENSLMDMVQQAAFIKIGCASGHINQKPIMIFDPKSSSLPNSAFMPYLEDSFEVVDLDPKEWAPHHDIHPVSSFFYKYSDQKYGCAGDFFHECHTELLNKGLSSSPFKLMAVTIDKALEFLKNYGINSSDEFVLLYLNENEKNQESNPKLCDVNAFYSKDSSQYTSAVNHLLSLGLKVIRIGTPNSRPMFEHKGFIDLTSVEKPAEVDIFLSGQAKFYFGSACGPYHLSSAFGTPCCLTSFIPYGGLRENNFIQTLQFKHPQAQTPVNLEDLQNLGLMGTFDPFVYEQRGLKPIFPKQEANLNLVKEMLEYLEKGACFKLNSSYATEKYKYKILGGMSSDSLSIFD